MKYRPYVAWGRRQFRIGFKWQVTVHEASYTDWRYRWVGLTWQ